MLTGERTWGPLAPRPVRSSLEELLEGAVDRRPMKTADSLSGSGFERLRIDGEPHILKYLHLDDDWIQRAQGDLFSRPVIMWSSGLFDALPSSFDHTIVDVAAGFGRNGWGAAVLMRDVGRHLVDVAGGRITLEQDRRFIRHMAELHAHFWGFEDDIGLMPMGNRYYTLSPTMARIEADRGTTEGVPALVEDGWRRFAAEAPSAAGIVLPLLDDPAPLVEALDRTPQTLVHSDWKAGNLGSHPDGRTILIDWAFPGRAPATLDIAWYLAVNNELIPRSKEETIDDYRAALHEQGIDTEPWWSQQLELSLLGAFVLLGWSKTGEELAWWERRALHAVRHLG